MFGHATPHNVGHGCLDCIFKAENPVSFTDTRIPIYRGYQYIVTKKALSNILSFYKKINQLRKKF
jgi:hypothetical protein